MGDSPFKVGDLIAQLEAATEGSAELDEAIAGALSPNAAALGWTRSTEAALTLVPDDAWVKLSYPNTPQAYGWSDPDQRRPNCALDLCNAPHMVGARAATPALAVCAAALKARLARGT